MTFESCVKRQDRLAACCCTEVLHHLQGCAERLASETTGNKKAASALRMRPGVRSTEDQAAAGRRRRTAETMALFTWAVMLRLLSEEVKNNFSNTGWKITIACTLLQIGLTTILRLCRFRPRRPSPAAEWAAGGLPMSPYGCAANHCDRGALPFRKSTKSDKSAIARKMTSVVS